MSSSCIACRSSDMRIVYPESRLFRILFVVERVCRSANTGCPVPFAGPDFLCRIRSGGLRRVRAAAFSRTGSCQGRVGPFREFVRPGASRVFLQSVSMCRHAGPELLCCQADECPGVFPFLDRLRLLFQQPTPPEAGLRLPSFRFAGPRPGKGATFAPCLSASFTPGRSGSPRSDFGGYGVV